MRAVLLLLLILPAAAQPVFDASNPEGLVVTPNGRGRHAWKRQGIWRIGSVNGAPSAAVVGTMNALAALLKATPTGTALTGFWMSESRNATAGSFATGFFPFYLEDILVNGKFVPNWGGETESVYFDFNRLPGRLSRPVVARDGATEFYLRPQVTGEFRGFPVYDNDALVISRAGRDPWAPVPVGRVLKAAMADYEKDRLTAENRLAGLRKQNEETQSPTYEAKMREHLEKSSGSFRTSNPNKWQGRLEGMERELRYNREVAAKRANPERNKDGAWYWNPLDAHAQATALLARLTPAEAAAPACYLPAAAKDGRYAMGGDFHPAGADPNCQPLAMDNAAYFDPGKPRSAPQLLWINSFGRCATPDKGQLVPRYKPRPEYPPQGCPIHLRIWEELDWKRVAALVTP